MSEEKDDDSEFTWTAEKEAQVLIASLRKMPSWNAKENANGKELIRELLDKFSGGSVVPMLKNILSDKEKSELIKEEKFSQEFVQDLTSDFRADSPSLLDDVQIKHNLSNLEETRETQMSENSGHSEKFLLFVTRFLAFRLGHFRFFRKLRRSVPILQSLMMLWIPIKIRF